MRTALLTLSTALLCGFAAAPAPRDGADVLRGTMPLEILRDEGQAPRLGDVRIEVGGYQRADPLMLDIYFDSDGESLGTPKSVSWQMKFGSYCRDRPSFLQSVLIGPSGQVWGVHRVFVPAGPDRQQDWSSGGFSVERNGLEAQALLDAAAAGGEFTLALRDEDGRLWNTTTIDTLSPSERERLFEINRRAVVVASPETTPVAHETQLVVTRTLPVPPQTSLRRCPMQPE